MRPWLNAAMLATLGTETGEFGARASADVCAWSFSAGAAVRDLGSSAPSFGVRAGFCSQRALVWLAGGADFRWGFLRRTLDPGVWAQAFWSFGDLFGPSWGESGAGIVMSSILPAEGEGLLSVEMYFVSPRWRSVVALRAGSEGAAPIDGGYPYWMYSIGVDIQVPAPAGGGRK